MAAITSAEESQNKISGAAISAVIHAALFLLLFFVPISPEMPDPPPPKLGGVMVALGEPDRGKGFQPAPKGQQMDDPSQTVEVPDPKPDPKPTPAKPTPVKPTPTPPSPTKPSTKPSAPSSSVVTESPEAAVKRRAAEAAAKAKADSDAKAAATAKAKADAAAKAAADAKAKADAKGKFGDKFGNPNNTGPGNGNTTVPGNGGDPNGDPNSTNLDGVGGSGSVGGGLGGRKVKTRPPSIVAKVNASGVVVITVCVGADGRVTKATYKQGGSTTNNPALVNQAIANAKLYAFEGTTEENQCGTVTYNFKLQ
jgi:membrane protein involved in colicin uptake